jgi:hypothetical protein
MGTVRTRANPGEADLVLEIELTDSRFMGRLRLTGFDAKRLFGFGR